jgi:hypothetical protein
MAVFRTYVRNITHNGIRRRGYKKTGRTADIVGCDFDFLKYWLELTFVENYGIDIEPDFEVHVDHKIPLCTAKTEEEVLKLCHWSTLQYLLACDNLSKNDNVDWSL